MKKLRFLHTSDWHLGQNFMGKSRIEEHKAFLSWLLNTINKFYKNQKINKIEINYKV
jgi:exonuclease SbcD